MLDSSNYATLFPMMVPF